jgi:hypothetical protein
VQHLEHTYSNNLIQIMYYPVSILQIPLSFFKKDENKICLSLLYLGYCARLTSDKLFKVYHCCISAFNHFGVTGTILAQYISEQYKWISQIPSLTSDAWLWSLREWKLRGRTHDCLLLCLGTISWQEHSYKPYIAQWW